jgi:signal transduction histidine kinase/CheY-like chemotaxis protein
VISGIVPRLAAAFGILLVVSLLLVRFNSPDPAVHERILDAIRTLTLIGPALQRDALEARAGTLPNYDPLVRDTASLRDAVAELRRVGNGTIGELNKLAEAIDEQEALLEAFKSDNALLRNSLRYLGFSISAAVTDETGTLQPAVASELSRFAEAMLVFMQDPRADSMRRARALLDRLGGLPVADVELKRKLHLLMVHGRLIVARLPVVDTTLGRLIALPLDERVRALHSAYLDHHAQTLAFARLSQNLVYLAAVALAVCLGVMFYAMWTRAHEITKQSRLLQSRLDLHGLVTDVSTRVATARHREDLDEAISHLIGRLGEIRGFDRVYVILADSNGLPAEVSHWWTRTNALGADQRNELLSVLRDPWMTNHFAAREYIAIPSVSALPSGAGKRLLRHMGVAAWLYLPIRAPGQHVGYLGFETSQDNWSWQDTDITLVGTVGEVIANAIDRDRSEARRKEVEARLRQSEKMEAMGRLAGGIAHDYNNILGAILGNGEMALLTLGVDSPARPHVQEMVVAGERAAALVGNILLFGRRGCAARRPVPVQPVIEEVIGMLRATLPADISIRSRFEAAAATVPGDPTQIHQVAMNLCTNAIQAMEDGILDVALDLVEITEDRAVSSGVVKAGEYVRLSVTDTGCGMDEATRAHIFEPFFTTKAIGHGTGLGLATVHGIVTEQGGGIEVRSQPGVGSTFEVYFALDGALSEKANAAAWEETPHHGGRGEVILLVDDEVSLVRLGEEMLAGLGFEPVGFESSERALEAFLADPMRFDLLLSDSVMPEITGLMLAAEIYAIRPELPILLMTAHSVPMPPSALREAGVRAVLKKPIRPRELAAAILPLLGQSYEDLPRLSARAW